MTKHAFPILILAGALAVSACSSKKDVLPAESWQAAPAAPEAPIDQPGTVPPVEQVAPTTLSGMQADMVAAAGADTVYFAFDSYGLDEAARAVLGGQAEWLVRNGSVRANVEGHTDERGTREYNLALGERRANAAKNFLAAQGVDPGRLSVISFGKERPAVEGANEDAWARNRRAVTIVVSGGR
jgi:peptidoglycan-associated lipoprotein